MAWPLPAGRHWVISSWWCIIEIFRPDHPQCSSHSATQTDSGALGLIFIYMPHSHSPDMATQFESLPRNLLLWHFESFKTRPGTKQSLQYFSHPDEMRLIDRAGKTTRPLTASVMSFKLFGDVVIVRQIPRPTHYHRKTIGTPLKINHRFSKTFPRVSDLTTIKNATRYEHFRSQKCPLTLVNILFVAASRPWWRVSLKLLFVLLLWCVKY